MNIKSLIINFRIQFSRVILFIKEIIKLPHAKKYLLFSIPFTIIFFIGTFPYDVLIRKKILSMENVQFKNVYLDDVEFSFFDVIRITNIGLIFKDNNELSASEILLDPSLNPFTLFSSGGLKSGIQINNLLYITTQASEINGNINGNVDLTMSKSGIPESGYVKLIIQNAMVKLNEINLPAQFGGFPIKIPPIKITTLNIDTTIQNKKLIINSIKLTGPDLRGVITGHILLEATINNSKLNTNISIDSDSPLIANYKELLNKFNNNQGQIVIPLRGTLMNPVIETGGQAN